MRLIAQIGDIRDAIERGEIIVEFISNKGMLADVLTKDLPHVRRDILVDIITANKIFTF